MAKEITLQEHLKKISTGGWAGKVKKYGLKEARRRQSEFRKDGWIKQRARKTKQEKLSTP